MLFFVLVVSSLTVGCSTTATVSDLDRGLVEAEILDGDASRLFLSEGQTVEKSRVTDIDHPGNVHLTVGLVVAGTGLLQSASGLLLGEGRLDNELARTQFSVGVGYLLVGGILAYWGFDTWTTSKRAAESTDAVDSMGIRRTTLP